MGFRSGGDVGGVDGTPRGVVWKSMPPVTQSINGLCRESQLYPRTIRHDESKGVT